LIDSNPCTRLTLAGQFVKTRSVARPTQLAIFISILAIATRFFLIDQPYIDNWSWRQSDVAVIARNFYQNGFHFAYPQIDWAGDAPGYVGTEFPVFPFVAAICYKFFGVHEWVGRIQGVILFAAALPFFFLLVREIFDAGVARWALVFYGFAPLNVFAGREFMPDVPSLSLALIGLYFFIHWTVDQKLTSLFAAAGILALSILIKAPSVLIGVPIGYIALRRFSFSAFRRVELWGFAAITLVPSIVWYWHAHRLAEAFYPHHFFGAGAFRIMNASWYLNIGYQIATSTLTPLLCVLAIVGLFVKKSTKYAASFLYWLGAIALFIFAAGWGHRHQWYQLPLIPIGAAFGGAACCWLGRKVRASMTEGSVVFIAILFVVVSLWSVRPFYRPWAADLRIAGLYLAQSTPKDSLIIAADCGDPTLLYYAKRKGWHFLEKDGIYNGHPASNAEAINDLEELRLHGATYIVFYSATFWWLDYYREFAEHLDAMATTMKSTPEFKVYQLQPK